MSDTASKSILLKVRKPMDRLGGQPGDLLAIYPDEPPAERVVLMREAEGELHRRLLDENVVLATLHTLGVTAEMAEQIRALLMPDGIASPLVSTTAGADGRTVLVVEDDYALSALYRKALERFGYGVLEAADGRTALKLAATKHPALVLLDLALPGLNGWDVCKHLHADSETREIPVVAVTGCNRKEDHERAQKLGFTAYLTKPIFPADLLGHVERLLPLHAA